MDRTGGTLDQKWNIIDVTRYKFTKKWTDRTSNTVEFPPDNTHITWISTKESAINTDLDLVDALNEPATAAPFLPIGAENLQIIRKLAENFKHQKDPTKLLTNEAPSPRLEATIEREEESTQITRGSKGKNI